MKFYLGQRFIDHRSRMYMITDTYSANEAWVEDGITLVFELEKGAAHVQGDLSTARMIMIGFAGEDGNRLRMTLDDARKYVKKGLLNFE